MNIGYRIFVIENDSSISPISQKLFEKFYFKDEPCLERYAGKLIHFAAVFYQLQNRKPKQIIKIDSMKAKVLSDGSIDKDHYMQGLKYAVNQMGSNSRCRLKTTGNIVDATSIFEKKTWENNHPDISGSALRQILHNLFG